MAGGNIVSRYKSINKTKTNCNIDCWWCHHPELTIVHWTIGTSTNLQALPCRIYTVTPRSTGSGHPPSYHRSGSDHRSLDPSACSYCSHLCALPRRIHASTPHPDRIRSPSTLAPLCPIPVVACQIHFLVVVVDASMCLLVESMSAKSDCWRCQSDWIWLW